MDEQPKNLDEIFTLAEKYRELRSSCDEVKADLAERNVALDKAKLALTDAMANAECRSFAHGDNAYSLTCTTRYSAVKDTKDEFYEALRDHGYDSLFSVNAQTLGSFLKERVKEFADENDGVEQLPDWLEGLVSGYDDIGIQMRTPTQPKKKKKIGGLHNG
jgi:DNA-binding ferritin-like protein